MKEIEKPLVKRSRRYSIELINNSNVKAVKSLV